MIVNQDGDGDIASDEGCYWWVPGADDTGRCAGGGRRLRLVRPSAGGRGFPGQGQRAAEPRTNVFCHASGCKLVFSLIIQLLSALKSITVIDRWTLIFKLIKRG